MGILTPFRCRLIHQTLQSTRNHRNLPPPELDKISKVACLEYEEHVPPAEAVGLKHETSDRSIM